MADADLTQELGFDASAAIASLNALDGIMAKFEQRWTAAAQTLNTFNSAGRTTTSLLGRMVSQANAAAAAMNKLNAGGPRVSGGGASADLLRGQDAAAAMSALLGQTSSNAAAAANSIGKVGGAANSSLGVAAAATNRFTVSFETLVRVISTQLIVRALSALRNAVEESFTANLQFVKSLSEIQTIDAGSSIEQIGKEVRDLSDSFNLPLLDSAKAKYEILSNGFVTAADQANLFTASAKFSKTAIADMSTSVDLLSGTLNAYGLSSEEAESVAAKFFKTVDLGKTIGSELAVSFGRVAPVAAELGVSISELDASFSTITIAGVKTSEAATQIRASLTALLKPSDAAKEALHSLGYENGQQLIAAKGLQGAFQALIGTTNGQSDAIAKLFQNVRAINAVLRLTGTGVDTFQEHLSQISNISKDAFNKTYQLRINTNAEKVSQDLQKLSNFFTVDLGAALVNATHDVFGFVGGVDTLTSGLKAVVPLITAAVGVLTLYGGAMAYASLQTRLASLEAGKLGLAMSGLFAIAAAFSVGEFIGDRFVSALEGAQKQFEQTMDKQINARRSAAEQEVQIDGQKNARILQAFNSFIADQRKAYFSTVDTAKQANAGILSDTKSTLDKIIQAREEHAKDLSRLVGQQQSNITESQQRQRSAQDELADSTFNFRNSRFNGSAQIFQLQKRAAEIASQAAGQLGRAKTPDQLQGALGQFSRASGFAQQAQSLAQTNGNLSQQASVQKTIQGILEAKVRAETQYQALQAKSLAQTKAAAAEEEKRVTLLKSLAKDVLKGSDLFDQKGNPLSSQQRQANLKKAQGSLQQFLKVGFSRNQFDVGDLFKFDDLKRRLESSVTGTEIQQLKVLPDSLTALNKQISKGIGEVEVAVKLAASSGLDTSKLKGKNALDTFQGLSDLAADQAKRVSDQSNLGVLQQFHQDQANKFAGSVQGIFGAQNQDTLNAARATAIGARLPFDPSAVKAEVAEFASLKQQITAFANGADLSADEVEKLTSRVDKFISTAPTWAKITNDVGALANALGAAGNAANNRRLANANPQGTDAGKQALQQDQSVLSQLASKLGVAEQASSALSESAAATAQQYSAQLTLATQLSEQLERQAAAQERISAARASAAAGSVAESFGGMPNARHYATGGFVKYFDRGGFASRGTDTVPAMLTPGEMVINAASTRKFFPELQAINSGASPASQSPTVVNNHYTVGDVNIHGTAEPMGPRDVARAIQRELRRGTIPNKF